MNIDEHDIKEKEFINASKNWFQFYYELAERQPTIEFDPPDDDLFDFIIATRKYIHCVPCLISRAILFLVIMQDEDPQDPESEVNTHKIARSLIGSSHYDILSLSSYKLRTLGDIALVGMRMLRGFPAFELVDITSADGFIDEGPYIQNVIRVLVSVRDGYDDNNDDNRD